MFLGDYFRCPILNLNVHKETTCLADCTLALVENIIIVCVDPALVKYPAVVDRLRNGEGVKGMFLYR